MSGTVRVGVITDVDNVRRQARVHFPDVDIVSGWLTVVKSSSPEWMPDVGDIALCLYNDVFNGDGYILGVLTP